MQQLQLDEFLRSLKQNIDMPHSLLLGAGASIESGVQSATECIWYCQTSDPKVDRLSKRISCT